MKKILRPCYSHENFFHFRSKHFNFILNQESYYYDLLNFHIKITITLTEKKKCSNFNLILSTTDLNTIKKRKIQTLNTLKNP